MKKIAWDKGGYRIVPFGVFWADMVYQTHRTIPDSYTLYVPQRRAPSRYERSLTERNDGA